MKYLFLIVLAIPLSLTAQQPLQPCVYGLPCINVGGSPQVLPRPQDNQLVRLIQGRDLDSEIAGGRQIDVRRCDGLTGDRWFACNFVNIHGCGKPGPDDWYSAPLDPGILSLVAEACGWK
jgi:hypothetical protein